MDFGVAKQVTIYTLLENSAKQLSSFYGQHGVSFLLDVENEMEEKRILFDVGQSAEPILHNMEILEIDPSSIDMIFLSHCHLDHTGGLFEMLKNIDKPNIPIVAHPEIFRKHFLLEPHIRHVGLESKNKKEEIEKAGGNFVLSKTPFSLMNGVVSTGEIEDKVDFEKEVTLDAYTVEEGNIVKDQISDDMSLAINLEGEDLLIISGCSHSGIVSIIEKGMKITEKDNVGTVIGGFHLIGAKEKRIQKTVEAFKDREVEKVYTGHCTGKEAECHFLKEWGNHFKKLSAGKKIVIPKNSQ